VKCVHEVCVCVQEIHPALAKRLGLLFTMSSCVSTHTGRAHTVISTPPCVQRVVGRWTVCFSLGVPPPSQPSMPRLTYTGWVRAL